jgi:hypothetical protein
LLQVQQKVAVGGSWPRFTSMLWRTGLSMNQRRVGQTFLSAGLGDFLVARWTAGLESPALEFGRFVLDSGRPMRHKRRR